MPTMQLIDVNVLLYALRTDARNHELYRSWLEESLASGLCGTSDLVLSAVLRISTHPGLAHDPVPFDTAVQYVEGIRRHGGCTRVEPGPRHWDIFIGLCQAAGVRGAMVTDAYFAALAIEHGATWITTDRDYARFPGLRWRHPLDTR